MSNRNDGSFPEEAAFDDRQELEGQQEYYEQPEYDEQAANYDPQENSDQPAEEAQPEEKQEKKRKRDVSEREKRRIAKQKKRERSKEIRHILIGSYFTLEDGRMASGGGKWMSPLGVGDGASSALLFGIKMKRYHYGTRMKSNKQALFAVKKAMKNIGRELALDTAPNTSSCYVRSLLFRPVVLVFEEISLSDGTAHLELQAYCGRSIFSFFSIRRAVSRLDKELPENISRA